ncbi:MAG TPA: D-Ala-D-Ala carboxypeptidase family metallohydrolase [Vicinamibacterales bacterium]|nr:D-Ala-D-Ala carboxypeptidase family metallohydrolase [Vicinamibacterales bacterium]
MIGRPHNVIALLTLAASATVLSAGDLPSGERFRARTLTFPYTSGAIYAMPHEKLTLALTAPATQLFTIGAPQGALTATGPNRWVWEAPGDKGRYPIEVRNPAGRKVMDFSVFVMVPATEVQNGFLNGFEIGHYPAAPSKRTQAYVPPKGFIEVTRDNEDTKISPHFRLKQFLTKQKSGYPKYLVLDERLIVLLEGVGAALEPLGYNADDIFIMSGYRTPFYNKAIGDTPLSMHQWGRAADIFLDKNHDGMMDDFNKDKAIDRQDAVALANVLEAMAATAEWSPFIGGIGIYGATAAHGPFVHVDTRPWKARWSE